MTWLDLEQHILEEFADHAERQIEAWRHDEAINPNRLYYWRVRRLPEVRTKENADTRMRRRIRRLARAAARPPCPQCSKPVERIGRSATLPIYCTRRCMRAATYARWWEKHGAERNARRRKGTRAVEGTVGAA